MVCESVIIKVNAICIASSHYPDLPVDDDTSCTGRKARDIKHNNKKKRDHAKTYLLLSIFTLHIDGEINT